MPEKKSRENPYQKQKRKLEQMVQFFEDWVANNKDPHSIENQNKRRMFRERIALQSDRVRELSSIYLPQKVRKEKSPATKPEQSIFIDVEGTERSPTIQPSESKKSNSAPQKFFSNLAKKFGNALQDVNEKVGVTTKKPKVAPEPPIPPEPVHIKTYFDDPVQEKLAQDYVKALILQNKQRAFDAIRRTDPKSNQYKIRIDNLNRTIDHSKTYNKTIEPRTILPLDLEPLKYLLGNAFDTTAYLKQLLRIVNKILPPLEDIFTPEELHELNSISDTKSPRTVLVEALARGYLQDVNAKGLDDWCRDDSEDKVSKKEKQKLTYQTTRQINYQELQRNLIRVGDSMDSELSHPPAAKRPSFGK